MYFIKLSQSAHAAELIGITRANVYCLCPKCGKTVPVDLQRFLGDSNFTLNTAVLCDDCSKEHLRIAKMKAILFT